MFHDASTSEHFNNLIRFRQALYDSGFSKLRDAQFELLDALLVSDPINSFPELSLSPVFRRKWPSAYAAMEDGGQDADFLAHHLCAQVPTEGVQLFGLDGSAWPRPHAPTLKDRQYVYSPSARGSIVVGYPYSAIAWLSQRDSSWALPLDIERVSSARNIVDVGVEQVKQLCELRACEKAFDVVVADRNYGNHRFLAPLNEEVNDQKCGLLVRMRRDRVLYTKPPLCVGRGRPRVHGERFAFKEPETWSEPRQHLRFWDSHWGEVEIQYWSGLHIREAPDTELGVLRARVHLEKEKPPDAMWLGWRGPARPAVVLWRYYQWRWTIEPSIRWRKEQLHWTLPRFRSDQASERWTMLVSLAQWTLHLARSLVEDNPLPWQKPQTELTPGRVQRGMGALFTQIGTPATPSKTRGKSPGWTKGRLRRRPERYPVVRKGSKKSKKRRKAA